MPGLTFLPFQRRASELTEAEALRQLELQRFAEFGRISARLLHEVANPLAAASLHLGQLDAEQSAAIRRARNSLRQLERYVLAARRQLQSESGQTAFSVHRELQHSLTILKPLARARGITIKVFLDRKIRLHGDPVKFNQVVSNLVANAIDAYDGSASASGQLIEIRVTETGRAVQLIVRDWGKGISQLQAPYIFLPFYSSKAIQHRGLGIGLPLVKETVERDFGGSVRVRSHPAKGTAFILRLRRANL